MALESFPSQELVPGVSPEVVPPLKFRVQPQGCYDHWCWAAVAASVSQFLNTDSKWTQCCVAKAVLGDAKSTHPCDCDCCDPKNKSSCNVDEDLELALGKTQNWTETYGPNLELPSVVDEITAGRPVCLRIIWPAPLGGAHFVGVYAAWLGADQNYYFSITDPITTTGTYSVDALRNEGYGEDPQTHQPLHGTWSDTFFTQKAPPP